MNLKKYLLLELDGWNIPRGNPGIGDNIVNSRQMEQFIYQDTIVVQEIFNRTPSKGLNQPFGVSNPSRDQGITENSFTETETDKSQVLLNSFLPSYQI